MFEPADFVIRQGDTAPRIIGTLTDGNGDPVDVSGGTARLHLHGLTVDNDMDLNAEVGDENVVFYDWQTGDTTEPGYYSGEWQVTMANGQIQSFPNDGVFLVQVAEQLA